MKLSNMFTALVISLFILQGCNANNDASPPPEQAATDQNNDNAADNNTNNVTTDTANAFNFTSFELDVDYSNNKSYEAEYGVDADNDTDDHNNDNDIDNIDDNTEANIKDNINNKTLYGGKAFDELHPIFENLQFDQNTPKDEVIAEVLNAFNLKDDYTKFELEVTFSDGTKKEYTSTK